MRKKVIVFLIVIVAGFTSGYFSSTVTRFFSNMEFPSPKLAERLTPSKNTGTAAGDKNNIKDSKANLIKGSITHEQAISHVKSLPVIRNRIDLASSRGSQVTFRADQQPARDYPVWLVEIRETYPNQIPDIMFIKVDAYTGRVLDLLAEELQVEGLKLSTPAAASIKIKGKTAKYKTVYDKVSKQRWHMYIYEGLQVKAGTDKKIADITLTGQDLKGPRDLTVGTDKSEVIKKLGKANIAQENVLIYNSLDDKECQLHVKLDDGGSVSELILVNNND